MKRKRFEKLLIGRHGMSPRKVRESTQNLIELRRRSDDVRGDLFAYNAKTGKVGYVKFYSYKETLNRYEQGKPVVGIGENE